ncbi:MAG: hypothetical protein KDA89_21625, partial [Planctomycetaceae bacterium]|nr:hypothetical protein [Planctomycetaceae bacterium]
TTYSTTSETTLVVRDGEPQTVRARVAGGDGDGREVLITVTATAGPQKHSSADRTRGAAPDGFRRPESGDRSSDNRSSDNRSSGNRSTDNRSSDIRSSESDRPGTGGPNRGGFGRDGFGRGNFGRGGAPGNRPPSFNPGGSPSDPRANGFERLFQQLDQDKDSCIGQQEWNSVPFAEFLEARGFRFTGNMTQDQFTKEMQPIMEASRAAREQNAGRPTNRRPTADDESKAGADRDTGSQKDKRPDDAGQKPQESNSPGKSTNSDADSDQKPPATSSEKDRSDDSAPEAPDSTR